jgi:hypothetical protein
MRKPKAVSETALGLGADVEVPKLTPALQPAEFSRGVLARYEGAEDKESRAFDRSQKLHTFALGAEFSKTRFALWGVVDLDMKLKTIRRGSVVLLRYEGKVELWNDRMRHAWSVRPFHGTVAQLQDLQAEYRDGSLLVQQAVELLDKIGAEKAELDMDDDLPF